MQIRLEILRLIWKSLNICVRKLGIRVSYTKEDTGFGLLRELIDSMKLAFWMSWTI